VILIERALQTQCSGDTSFQVYHAGNFYSFDLRNVYTTGLLAVPITLQIGFTAINNLKISTVTADTKVGAFRGV
jgi:hypothetical protein